MEDSDSMGHSAKFGAYTIFSCTLPMILHFALVQVRNKFVIYSAGNVRYTGVALM